MRHVRDEAGFRPVGGLRLVFRRLELGGPAEHLLFELLRVEANRLPGAPVLRKLRFELPDAFGETLEVLHSRSGGKVALPGYCGHLFPPPLPLTPPGSEPAPVFSAPRISSASGL